jgi:hypothetical protein
MNNAKSKHQSTLNSTWKKSNRNIGISKHLSIVILNENGLTPQSKNTNHQIGSKKQDPTICCLQETHLTTKDTHKLKD